MKAKKILLVDDDRDMHILVENILDGDEYCLVSAMDGAQGLEKARVEKPDLIILDVQMPELDGFKVFKQLKSSDITRNTPVIMLTGIGEKRGIHFSKEEMGAYYKVEPQHYLDKPIRPEKLKEYIDKLL